MVSLGSSASAAAISSLGYPVTEKLARNNHPLWRVQVLSTLKGAQVAHFLKSSMPVPPASVAKKDKPDEQVSNPDYETWVAKDQQILNYLLPLYPGTFWRTWLSPDVCCSLGGVGGDVLISVACPGDQHADGTSHRAEGQLHRC